MLYNNITNNIQNDETEINRFTSFLKNYNPIDRNTVIKKRHYIKTIKENIEVLLLENPEIPIINIEDKYYIVSDILKTMFFWSKLYYMQNNNIIEILNKMRLFYKVIPGCNINNIQQTKQNFIRFIRILFDYGFKTLFLFDTRPGPQIPNELPNNFFNNLQPIGMMIGGNNNYYDKYMKYKTKYLNKN